MWARPEWESLGGRCLEPCTHGNPGKQPSQVREGYRKGRLRMLKTTINPNNFLSRAFGQEGCNFFLSLFLLIFMPLWHFLSEF